MNAAPTGSKASGGNDFAASPAQKLCRSPETMAKPVIPGEILFAPGDIEAFKGRTIKDLTVENTADRPIQVGSHCHFFEVNRGLLFDREQVFGYRLCIPAGTAARFEPGEE